MLNVSPALMTVQFRGRGLAFSLSQILKVFLTELLFSVPLNKMWMECLVSACRSQPVFLLTYAGHPRKGVLDML